jgi:hypothetical protein
MRTGFLRAHESSHQEVFHQCVTASAMVSYGRSVNHDAEVMYYHHLFAQVMNEVEDAGYTAEQTDISGHPAEQIFDRIMSQVDQEDDSEFYQDCAHLYHCLSAEGVIAKLQKLVDSMETGQPLSPTSADDPILVQIIHAADQYRSAVVSEDLSILTAKVLAEAGQLPSTILQQDQFQQYLVGMLTGTKEEPDVISTYDDDGYMLCACAFCEPRIAMWEAIREEGNIPELLPLQESMIEMVGLSLERLYNSEEEEYDDEFEEEEELMDLDQEEQLMDLDQEALDEFELDSQQEDLDLESTDLMEQEEF